MISSGSSEGSGRSARSVSSASGSIIIAMPAHADAVRLRDMLLRSGRYSDIILSSMGSQILSLTRERDISLVISAVKFHDMGYEEMVSSLAPGIPVLVLTGNPSLIPFGNSEKLVIPFRASELLEAVRSLLSRERQKPKKRSTRSPREQQQIDEAKHLLMEKKGMSEPEAFRYMQKTSMDASRSLYETASMVLLLYKDK